MLMSAPLTKQHVVVHTTTISVKVMRIGKRQLTMSVFRQLEQESIISGAGNLKGVPWGKVNYRWKDTPDWAAYYVVWQDEGELKICPVPSEKLAMDILGRCDTHNRNPNKYCWAIPRYVQHLSPVSIPNFTMSHLIDVIQRKPNPYSNMTGWIERILGHLATFDCLDTLFIAT